MKDTTCTLTAVTLVPIYRNIEWDWLHDGLTSFDFEGTDCYEQAQKDAMFERLKDVINNVTAYPTSDRSICVLYDLVDNHAAGGEEQEMLEVTIRRDAVWGSRFFHLNMPGYPLFEHSVYSALAMFAYQVADAVQANSLVSSISAMPSNM